MRNQVQKIPADKIKEIVEENIIANAVAISSNLYMKFLFVIWYNYIDPNGSGTLDCPFCLQNVLENFRAMQGTLVEVHKENQKLDEL